MDFFKLKMLFGLQKRKSVKKMFFPTLKSISQSFGKKNEKMAKISILTVFRSKLNPNLYPIYLSFYPGPAQGTLARLTAGGSVSAKRSSLGRSTGPPSAGGLQQWAEGGAAETLAQEMADLMHDYDVMSRYRQSFNNSITQLSNFHLFIYNYLYSVYLSIIYLSSYLSSYLSIMHNYNSMSRYRSPINQSINRSIHQINLF